MEIKHVRFEDDGAATIFIPRSRELSGHSMRIGAAQDTMVAGFDALAIIEAGGWKSANVVLRYVGLLRHGGCMKGVGG